jgi:FkbM family methyltransferase
MDRRIDTRLFVNIIKHSKYVPLIIRSIKNWPTYFLYYLGIKRGGGAYFFRNGGLIRDKEGTASGTIAVVFIRKHYGSIAGKSTIVEIGANIGTFAIYAAMSDRNVRLYSYEPIKANYDVLVRNIADNGCQDRIKAFNLGVASKAERREFYLTSSPEHSLVKSEACTHSESVDCIGLADVLNNNGLSKVNLLKINAEGAEYEILYSTPKECFDKIDEIRMEYHEHRSEKYDLENLKSFLEGFGYVTTHLYRHTDHEGFLWMKKMPASSAQPATASSTPLRSTG